MSPEGETDDIRVPFEDEEDALERLRERVRRSSPPDEDLARLLDAVDRAQERDWR
jgi:hypothetical protein